MKKSIPTSFVLESANYRMRIPHANDIPFVFSATRYNGFNDGMLWDPPSTEEELIGPLENNIQAWKNGQGYAFTILSIKTDELLGRISIRNIREDNKWDIGFWVHPKYYEKGIMTEVVKEVLNFGFNSLGADRIEACHATWNKASEKVLLKNGFKFVEFIEKGFQKRGVWNSENLLAIDIQEWQIK